MEKPDDLYLAWLAGFWDGEGTFGITRRIDKRQNNAVTYQIRAEVTNTDHSIILGIRAKLGNVGSLFELHKDHPIYKSALKLSLYGDNARQLATWILPFLQLKARQAQAILDFPARTYISRGRGNGPGRLLDSEGLEAQRISYEQLAILNQRGNRGHKWVMP